MRILCISYAYAPSVGGIESMSRTLTEEWRRMGHQVKIVTHTPDPKETDAAIFRRPGFLKLLELYRWSDICFMHNISLHYAVPFLFSRRTVLTAQGLPNDVGEPPTLASRIKRYFYSKRLTIGVSEYMSRSLGGLMRMIPNCYDDEDFTNTTPWGERTEDVIVVARLFDGKGVHVAVQAIKELREKGQRFRLTVVGNGPEEENLRAMVNDWGLEDQVSFAGTVRGRELSDLVNRHKLFLVPSTYGEPFGIVCLLGVACGCVVIGSDTGGIPDAIGPCGVLVPKGDPSALAEAIGANMGLADNPFSSRAAAHLARHTAEAVSFERLAAGFGFTGFLLGFLWRAGSCFSFVFLRVFDFLAGGFFFLFSQGARLLASPELLETVSDPA